MASVYELYLGGPRQQNTDWAIFPAAPFNVANTSNLAPPAKTPIAFGVSRTLDFVNDKALSYFFKKNMASTPVVGDSFGLIVVPANSLFLGCWWKVNTPLPGTTGTFKLRFRTAAKDILAATTLHTAASGFVPYDGAAAVTTGATAAAGLFHHFPASDILDLVLVALPVPNTLVGLNITVTPVYYNFQSGLMN
jgi:hypothetical protein